MASTAVKMASTDHMSVYKSRGSTLPLAMGTSSSPPAISTATATAASASASASASVTTTLKFSQIKLSSNLAVETMAYLEVIKNCNKFDFEAAQASLFQFFVLDHEKPVGYMLPDFIQQMDWNVAGFEINEDERTVRLNPETSGDVQQACGEAFVALCEQNVGKVKGLNKWVTLQKETGNADHHPILGLRPELSWLKVPTPLRGVFGIVTCGAHMTMYCEREAENQDDASDLYIWVSKRSRNVTYPGMLDQLVAGALAPEDNKDPLETMRREAMEEAGLEVDAATGRVTKDGADVGSLLPLKNISFYDQKNETAGTERGQLEPGVRYTFELKVAEDFTPVPCEPHAIDGFYLWSVDQVMESLKNGQWKPNCALVMLHFLQQKGRINPSESQYDELLLAFEKKLPFDLAEL